MLAPLVKIGWPAAYRVVPDHAPALAALGSVVDAEDLPMLLAIEAMTNPYARRAASTLTTMSIDEWRDHARNALVMLPFMLPSASRFSDGSYGVFYAGNTWETAARESAYHREQALRASHDPSVVLRVIMQAYTVNIDAELHDLRPSADPPPPTTIYHDVQYADAQNHALRLRAEGTRGVLYNSVRHVGGECVGLMTPQIIRDSGPDGVIYFDWDGTHIGITRAGVA